LEISEEVINADLVLNLSMMKIGRASSADNILKMLKKDNYEAARYLRSEKEIIDEINGSVSNILTIGEADSIRRSNGIIAYLGIVLAGKNPLSVDVIFNRITHVIKMPEILSNITIENIPVAGRTIKEVEYDVD
jgi:hypothetical protein